MKTPSTHRHLPLLLMSQAIERMTSHVLDASEDIRESNGSAMLADVAACRGEAETFQRFQNLFKECFSEKPAGTLVGLVPYDGPSESL